MQTFGEFLKHYNYSFEGGRLNNSTLNDPNHVATLHQALKKHQLHTVISPFALMFQQATDLSKLKLEPDYDLYQAINDGEAALKSYIQRSRAEVILNLLAGGKALLISKRMA